MVLKFVTVQPSPECELFVPGAIKRTISMHTASYIQDALLKKTYCTEVYTAQTHIPKKKNNLVGNVLFLVLLVSFFFRVLDVNVTWHFFILVIDHLFR